ncbi:TPA: hypothetical protein OT818_004384 [Citrobacter koseri]|nr:hypothetical protein [Citrobacter koseri]
MKNLIPPINTPDNLFHDGNPLTGELGTLVTAEWLNNYQGATRDLQSELLSILAEANINPESSALQLLTAIRALTLSRSNPFGDIKNDGAAAISKALENLGLGELAKAGVGNGLIATNGYATLPLIIGGEKKVLIIQWGTTSTTGSDGKATATFPVSFTRIPFYVGLTETTGETSGIGSVCVWSKEIKSATTTGFAALASKPWASSFTAGEAANYLAVGF